MSSDSLSEHKTACGSRKRMECASAPISETAIQAAVRFHVTITRQANRRAQRAPLFDDRRCVPRLPASRRCGKRDPLPRWKRRLPFGREVFVIKITALTTKCSPR
jgi:hypothetical protein